MLNYLRGEFYRLLCKKSLYLYFAVLAFGYVGLAFIRSSTITATSFVEQTASLLDYLPVLLGGYLFASIYTDDLSAKTLSTLVGFGMSRTKIVLTKTVLAALCALALYALVPLLAAATYAVFGWPPDGQALGLLCIHVLRPFLVTLIFCAIAGIAAWGLQRSTFAMVLYLFCAAGLIGGLLSTILNLDFVTTVLPNASQHLPSGTALRLVVGLLKGSFLPGPLVEYLGYLVAVLVLSVVVFSKKEMEY
jgi:ABC-type transport system involved in multi-copper enzyme maturation permease subunit